jgi:hypothetical protein
MGVVTLQILEPANGANYFSHTVPLRGALISTGHPALYYKWYSSLVSPPSPASTDASIPVAGPDPLRFPATLPAGSQVITFSAKDVAGDSKTDLPNVTHAGMAGGPPAPRAPAPCLIHVLVANPVGLSAGAVLNRASCVLRAEAPPRWDDAEYQKLNQLQYVWRFEPDPAGARPTAELAPPAAQLALDRTGPAPAVRYQGPLPSLGTGNYIVKLRVQKISDPSKRHEAPAVKVVLT